MPKTDKSGNPVASELPSTLQRSDRHAQDIFAEVHDSAEEEYHDEERAYRVAYAALKHSYEKVGDHWEAKEQKGPSDEQAKGGRNTKRQTAGGVDANASKEHLYELAKKLDVPGRSKMSKDELVKALERANDRQTAEARKK